MFTANVPLSKTGLQHVWQKVEGESIHVTLNSCIEFGEFFYLDGKKQVSIIMWHCIWLNVCVGINEDFFLEFR